MRNQPILLTVLLPALLIPFGLGSQAVAEDSLAPRIFPKTTTVLLQVADAKALREELKITSVGQLLQDPSVKKLVDDLWSVASDAMAKFENEYSVSLNDLYEMAQGEVAVGMVKRPRDAPGFVLLADVGDRPDALHALLERVEEMMLSQGSGFETRKIGDAEFSLFTFSDDEEQRSLMFCERESHLLVATHPDVAEKVILAWDGDEKAKPLGKDAIYGKTMKLAARNAKGEPSIRLFIDPVSTAYAATGQNGAAQAGLAVLPLLGLKEVEGLAATVTMNLGKFDWLVNAHLLIDGDRHGIPEALALEGHRPEVPSWIPSDVARCSQFQIDIKKGYRALEKLIDLFQGEDTVDNFVKNNISENIGIDFGERILPELTGRIVRIERHRPGKTDINPTSALGVEFKDAGKLEKMLVAVARKYSLEEQKAGRSQFYLLPFEGNQPNQDFEATSDDESADPERAERRRRRRERRRLMVRRNTPAVAAVDGYLIGADDRDLMSHIIEDAGRESFAESDVYRQVVSAIQRELGIERPAYVSWRDNREGGRQMFAMLSSPEMLKSLREGAASQPWMMEALKALEENPLPTFDAVKKYLAPSGTVLTNEENGFHLTMFSMKPEE